MRGEALLSRALGAVLPLRVSAFLEAVGHWARAQPDIKAVALVGSYARGAAARDSDIDLVILTPDAGRYLRDHSWVSVFGEPAVSRQESYGRVTSVRVLYQSGVEVEYGLTAPDWAESPLDAGTCRVVTAGMIALYDPEGIIARMPRARDSELPGG